MTGKQQTILVTGGAGYIGSHTVHALIEAGHRVVILDDLSFGHRELIPGDIPLVIGDAGDRKTAAEVLTTFKPDAVIHFAGFIINEESIHFPEKYFRNNAQASQTLIDTCIEHGVHRFIFSSSAAVYGAAPKIPISEDAPLGPVTPYGQSKLMTEVTLHGAAKRCSDFRFVALRYFNAAGADPLGRSGQCSKIATHLLKIACEAAVGLRDDVAIFGTDYDTADGTCIRDYIHVSDLASAHIAALNRLLSGGESLIANVGYGHGYSVRDVLAHLKKIVPELRIREAARRDGDVASLVADCRRIRQELDWEPRFDDLATVISSALAWERRLRDQKKQRPRLR